MSFQDRINKHPDLYTANIVTSTVLGSIFAKFLMIRYEAPFLISGLFLFLFILAGTYGFTESLLRIKEYSKRKSEDRQIRKLKESGRLIM